MNRSLVIVNNRRQFDAILCDEELAPYLQPKPICVVATGFDYNALRGMDNCTFILGESWDKNLTLQQRIAWKQLIRTRQVHNVTLLSSKL